MAPAVINETDEEPVKLEKVEIPAGSGNYFKLSPADKKRRLAMAAQQERIDNPPATEPCPHCGGTGVVEKAAEASAPDEQSGGSKPTKAQLLERYDELYPNRDALGARPKNDDIAAAIAQAEAEANSGDEGNGA